MSATTTSLPSHKPDLYSTLPLLESGNYSKSPPAYTMPEIIPTENLNIVTAESGLLVEIGDVADDPPSSSTNALPASSINAPPPISANVPSASSNTDVPLSAHIETRGRRYRYRCCGLLCFDWEGPGGADYTTTIAGMCFIAAMVVITVYLIYLSIPSWT